ncbi:MAG: hypothetical protein R3E48_02450 [Burkholderiaceae bacterium]
MNDQARETGTEPIRARVRFHLPEAALDSLFGEIRSRPGLRPSTHWLGLRRHRQSLRGDRIVDWIERRLGIDRAEAYAIGRRLVARGYLVPIQGDHDFEDSPTLYRFDDPNPVAGTTAGEPASPVPIGELAARMRAAQGIRPRTHHYRFVRYPNCFTGRDAVEWIMAETGVGRAEAIAIGQHLLLRNQLRHVFDEHAFADAGLLYRFV